MLKFTAEKEELKKVLGIVSLATEEKTDALGGHALFKTDKESIKLYSTNRDKIAYGSLKISDIETEEETTEFTADPKKIQALLNTSDMKKISFIYDSEKKTLDIYASENENSFLSFPSLDPEKFISFEEELNKLQELKRINSGIFLYGIRFIQGFLPSDERNKKFNRVYINKGAMYGSNGSNKIGAYESPELQDMDAIIFRKEVLPNIANMIDRINTQDIIIKTSSKFTLFASPDNIFGFGFIKTTDQAPKFPISLEEPDIDGLNLDRNILMRKINRLAITSNGNIGIKFIASNNNIDMNTITERTSRENMVCSTIRGCENKEFILEYKLVKTVLALFQATNINMYIADTKCILRNEANLEIIEEDQKDPIQKPFKAVALISLARTV